MIQTLSLCPTCYKKIPAKISFIDGTAWMTKECDQHGPFGALVEKDATHVSNFYQPGTRGNNNAIIIHTHNQCDMSCSWCYYPMGKERILPFEEIDTLLRAYKGSFRLLLSGGEPTIREDYFDFHKKALLAGWEPSTITNMVSLGDGEWFSRMLDQPGFVTGDIARFAMSFQHPKNYPEDILRKKMLALENLESAKLKAMCVMFSIQSLDELDWIRTFYDKTKELYAMLRIRTMFRNWANEMDGNRIYLSDLHKAFLRKFGDLHPLISTDFEHSNIYCLYMRTDDGMLVSLSSGPTVRELDYHVTSRPVFMLAMDGRAYPVPIAQIVNEGIDKGWKDGYRLQGGGN